ncbi:MAG: hypothetical protein WC471_01620 [Candidatus Woesearchaeota archaeon]
MALFKKNKTAPVIQSQIQQLSLKPQDQLKLLQKRVDVLQSSNIQLSTHIGETELNAEGEITRIQMLMNKIQGEMDEINRRIDHISGNMGSLIFQLNLTAKAEELDRFKSDMDRMQPFNFMTLNQFEKLVKEIVDEKFGE